MRIGIIGGGFAGPVTALALAERGFSDVTLYEESEDMRSKGFGIGLAGNGRYILSQLGVGIKDMPSAQLLEHMDAIGMNGEQIYTLPVPQVKDHMSYIVSREDLHQAILKKLETVDVHVVPSKHVSSVAHADGKETLAFGEGESETFDLVVGAGGINSVTRSTLYCHSTQSVSDWTTWWFWGGSEISFSNPRSYIAPGVTLGVFPLANGKHFFTCVFHGTPDSVLRSDQETMRAYLKSKLDQFTNLDEVINSAMASEQYMARRTSMINVRQSYCGHTILIGDAEHAFSPLLGLGTSLAIEDAFVLARELETASQADKTVHDAFLAYDKKRHPRIRTVQWTSGAMWYVVNIYYRWQQYYQRLGRFVIPKWFASFFYRWLVLRDV